MFITIRYLVRGAVAPESSRISPTDYFEALEPGETWAVDGIPRFDHARDYLPPELDVSWTDIRSSVRLGVSRVREVFTPAKRMSYWHRIDPTGSEELCISTQLSPRDVHIVRLRRQRRQPWDLSFSVLVTDLADGSQSEVVLFSKTQNG